MNSFTASQIACLEGIELPLWRLNDARPSLGQPDNQAASPAMTPNAAPRAAEPAPAVPVMREGADEQSPFADEIRRLLAWCQSAGQWTAPLQWQINPAISHSSLNDNLLQTPEPEKLMGSATLKRALWQLLSQRTQ